VTTEAGEDKADVPEPKKEEDKGEVKDESD